MFSENQFAVQMNCFGDIFGPLHCAQTIRLLSCTRLVFRTFWSQWIVRMNMQRANTAYRLKNSKPLHNMLFHRRRGPHHRQPLLQCLMGDQRRTIEEDIKKRHSGRNVPLTRERGLKKRRTNGSPESFRKAPLYNGRTYLTVAFLHISKMQLQASFYFDV